MFNVKHIKKPFAGRVAKAASLLIVFAICISLFTSCVGNTLLLTVDGNAITLEVMNYYVYISQSMLELYYESALDYTTPMEDYGGITFGEVVKQVAYQQIVIDFSYLMLAREYNLEFTEEELPIIEDQVQLVIDNVGDRETYNSFLNDMDCSDTTYRTMLYNQLLIKKVENGLCESGGPLALSEQEKLEATETYKDSFVNVEYVFLSTYNSESGEELDSTAIAEKKTLAKKIRALAVSGTSFEKLIDKYSEHTPEGGADKYSVYLAKDDEDVPSELFSFTSTLAENEISAVITTDLGFFIAKKLPFDDYFPTVVINTASAAKLETALSEAQSRMTIVTTTAYSNYIVD